MSMTDDAKAADESAAVARRRIHELEAQAKARDAELAEVKRLLDFTTK